MAFNWFLLVSAIILLVAIAIGSLYFLVYFQSEEDYNVAWLPKLVVMGGLTLAMVNILMLPLDVANQSSQGGLPMSEAWLILYVIIGVMVFIIIPFSVFYYESEGEKSQLISAIKWEAGLFFIAALTIILGYLFLGFAEISYTALKGGLIDTAEPDSTACPSTACGASNSTFTIQISLFIYGIGMLNIVGLIFFVVFGGIGLISLPMDLISDYKNRPRPIELEAYAKQKIKIRDRATRLIDIGKKLQAEEKNALSRKAKNKFRKNYNRFKQAVYLLEEDYERLMVAYKERGGSILKYWWFLLCGIVGGILSLAWIVHILLFVLPTTPIDPFLNTVFVGLDRTWGLLGTLAYGLFALYLLWAIVKGNVKFGLRIFIVTLHPMKIGDTMMNSLLFNTGLILACSVTVVQFCTNAFSSYARLTSVTVIFSSQVENLRYLTYVYQYYVVGMLVISLLTLLYLVIFPKEPATDKLIEKDLE